MLWSCREAAGRAKSLPLQVEEPADQSRGHTGGFSLQIIAWTPLIYIYDHGTHCNDSVMQAAQYSSQHTAVQEVLRDSRSQTTSEFVAVLSAEELIHGNIPASHNLESSPPQSPQTA